MTYIIRSPWTTEIGPYRGAALGALATDPQVILRQLHGLAIAIYQAQQRAAQNPGVEVTNVRNLLAQFQVVARRFLEASEGADPTKLGALDRFVLATGTWIEQSVQVLPRALSAIPRAFVDAIGESTGAVGWATLRALVPFALLGVLLFAGARGAVREAEKTRTYRRYVA